MLSVYENPLGVNLATDSVNLISMVAGTVDSVVQLMNTVLAVNVHGQSIFQQPKEFLIPMMERSRVLYDIIKVAVLRVHPSTRQSLPPSPLDSQHLNEWRETADYAATTLAMLAGIVDLETGFHSPLLGGSKNG
jgi:hypothetical protein